MFRVRLVCLLLSVACLAGLAATATAAQVSCDSVYCFTAEDFYEDEPLAGICITGLPDPWTGTVKLGARVLQPGDILTAQQLQEMTFHPLRTESDQQAVVTYLPIYEDRVAQPDTMTLSIRGKEDQAPVAQDSAIETYKNLPNTGKLAVSDPEGEALTYCVVRGPKRGTVELSADGNFTYTPKKNKVGVDSFTFTATDPAGNVSRQATVTVQILKPTDARQYTDTVDSRSRFEAEWLRNTGLFVGEQVAGQDCFQPQKSVSRGEFLTMLVKALDIPIDTDTQLDQQVPQWLRPYLAAALRAGLIADWPYSFETDAPITGEEAAVLVQNALDLPVSREAVQTLDSQGKSIVPTWAQTSLAVLAENGICMEAGQTLNREDVAEILYQVKQLSVNAPGVAVIRMQQ